MKRRMVTLVLVLAMMLSTTCAASAASDYDLAKSWANKHCKGATIEKVVTVSQGGTKGKVKGGKWTVKYPKKVQKGKKVTVYMVEKKGDVKAMVCLGKVK